MTEGTTTKEPEQIYVCQKELITRKIPLVKNSEGKWESNGEYGKIINDVVIREWFEDENGNELEMEEI